ncbi:MAG: hypothetical protein ABSC51_09045 [Gaiellaceae bacterium]|jgi:hypothetical protein
MTPKRQPTAVAWQVALGVIVAIATVTMIGPASAANSAQFKGKTKEGSAITFLKKGGSVASVNSQIYVTCDSVPIKGGIELFKPPGRFKADGKWHSAHASRTTVVLGGKVGFMYRVRVKFKGRRAVGRITLAFGNSSYDVLKNTTTFTNCSGVTNFQAQPK